MAGKEVQALEDRHTLHQAGHIADGNKGDEEEDDDASS